MTSELLSGVDALVRLLEVRHQVDEREGLATATMVSGYPGSPLGTFDLALDRRAKHLEPRRVLHRPGVNEELAAATVWGSQMGTSIPYSGVDGVAGVWYGKTPGLDRSGDVMKHGNAMGTGPNGSVVMFCGDDPSAKSSTLTCDSHLAFEDAAMPVLYPADQQDLLDLGLHAFHLSRYCGAWVGVKVVTAVADGIGTVDLDPERHRPSRPSDLLIDGAPWQHRPQATLGPHAVPDQEILVVQHRLTAAKAYARHNRLDRIVGAPGDARLGIVCAGKTYIDVLQAFTDLGHPPEALAALGVRVLKLAMTFPLVDETVLELAASVDHVLVVEEKRPFLESQLRCILHEAGSPVPVLGKRDLAGAPLASSIGELDAQAIAGILVRAMPALARPTPRPFTLLPILDVPGRAPGFCSGCPHNRSTVAPQGALVGGGVGCHGIMYFEPRQRDTKRLPPTPMGAEGVPWIGLAPFVDEPHLIQNLGDGTLSHSGTLAIRASVAAQSNVTFKILYNAAVAMTGGQDVAGLMDVPAMTRALEAEGVSRIIVCAEDPKHYGRRARWAGGVDVVGRDQLPEVQERLRDVKGVSVVIYDQRCAAEARRLRKRGQLETPPQRVIINPAVCEGCGDCGTKSNCLSVLPIETEFGDKREIHDLSCNRDYTCLEGDCPSFVTITPSTRGRRRARADEAARPSLPTETLPTPVPPTVSGRYGVYFTGIGGTGVITANRILATAAEADGYLVAGVDQTGLSQKAGAVVSHLHFATSREALGSAAVGSAGADLYLSGDILQAAGAKQLSTVRPGRTIAVVDNAITPTASMLQTDAPVPALHELEGRIADVVGHDRVAFVHAGTIAEAVFANHLLANIVLLGAAFQLGGLPLTAEAIGQAMAGQGAAAMANREAFEWGRWAVHAPAVVESLLSTAAGQERSPFDPSDEALDRAVRLVSASALPAEVRDDLMVRRTAQVIDYQNPALATRFLDLVAVAAGHDDALHRWELTRAVLESWFKLLTYKDEYEVARLHLAVDYDRVAHGLGIEGPYSLTYHLHPPTLRRLGMSKKLPLGKPYEIGFHVLRRMKRLRGTRLDIFGRDPDRRAERALIEDYEELVRESLSKQMPYEQRIQLASSVLAIKGYGPIKDEAIALWRSRVAELRQQAAVPTA